MIKSCNAKATVFYVDTYVCILKYPWFYPNKPDNVDVKIHYRTYLYDFFVLFIY